MRLACTLLLLAGWCWLPIHGLTQLERNELSRKFKYYFPSVRPISRENQLANQNGSFFALSTEVQILMAETLPSDANRVSIEVFFTCSFIDDRLVLRELHDRFEMLSEFAPWSPRIGTMPPTLLMTNTFLNPQTGMVTVYYRVKESIPCVATAWKHPFEQLECDLAIENSGDELVNVVDSRDLRSEQRQKVVQFQMVLDPRPTLRFSFHSGWARALLSGYLPSVFCFAIALFAQWKRRKVQVVVTVAALMCLVIMLSSRRPYSSVTLLDLWLSVTFLHSIFLLIVDLTLPARRIRYTLMLDVDGRPIERSPSEQSLPPFGGSRVLMAVHRLAGKTAFGERKAETRIEEAYPSQSHTPVQRHVTTTSIGIRKRFALLFICISYSLFVFVYACIVIAIN